MIDKLNVNLNVVKSKYYNESLTGRIYGFEARDLVYVFLEVEREFDIKINTLDILNYEFNTIQGIIDVIKKQKINSLI